MPNSKYKVGNYIYITDRSFSRVIRVLGELKLSRCHRNASQQRAVKRLGYVIDEGGHLIACIFGGSGHGINMVPMNKLLNRRAWKKMENKFKTWLTKGKSVDIDIKIKYKGKSMRPYRFVVTATVSSGKIYTYKFDN